MKWDIVFWHGYDETLAMQLLDYCDKDYSRQPYLSLTYEGSLDDFSNCYSGCFIVDRANRYIAVTQYNNFE